MFCLEPGAACDAAMGAMVAPVAGSTHSSIKLDEFSSTGRLLRNGIPPPGQGLEEYVSGSSASPIFVPLLSTHLHRKGPHVLSKFAGQTASAFAKFGNASRKDIAIKKTINSLINMREEFILAMVTTSTH